MKTSNVIKVMTAIGIALMVSWQFAESRSWPLSGQKAFEESAYGEKGNLTTKTHESIKAVPGTPDGVLMMQAQALFGKLPATMPGSEKDTPVLIALGGSSISSKPFRSTKPNPAILAIPLTTKDLALTISKPAWVRWVNPATAMIQLCLMPGSRLHSFGTDARPPWKIRLRGPLSIPLKWACPMVKRWPNG